MGRITEWLQGRNSRGRLVFSGTRRRLTSVAVRGDQMAKALGGLCLRSRFLTDELVASAPALIWIVEPDLELAGRFGHLGTPQIYDVINPAYDDARRPRFQEWCRAFRYLILNTEASFHHLGPAREDWRWWVVPHHHCNRTAYRLPEPRLEAPQTVGYVGQPEHLHDSEAIEATVRKMGLRWISAGTHDLDAYRDIDIGVAWTRRDQLRDETRSNVKMTNFAAHGIPSVVCSYASYREADAALGGGSGLIRSDLEGLIAGIEELQASESLRRRCHKTGLLAQSLFSPEAIADRYLSIVSEVSR